VPRDPGGRSLSSELADENKMTESDSIYLTVACSTACFVLGLFYFKIKSRLVQALLHFAAPIPLAFLAYWIPNLKYWNAPSYQGWDFVFTIQVMTCAIPASVIAALISKILRKRFSQSSGGDAKVRASQK